MKESGDEAEVADSGTGSGGDCGGAAGQIPAGMGTVCSPFRNVRVAENGAVRVVLKKGEQMLYEIRRNGVAVSHSTSPKRGYSDRKVRTILAGGHRYYIDGKPYKKNSGKDGKQNGK